MLFRLSYAVYLIDKILERNINAEIFIMYDVACTFKKYLKVLNLSLCHCVMYYLFSIVGEMTSYREFISACLPSIPMGTKRHAK